MLIERACREKFWIDLQCAYSLSEALLSQSNGKFLKIEFKQQKS